MSDAPDIRSIRNVALIAHGGGGKTTLAEALLFNAEAIAQRGTVEKGDTVMTTEPEEIAQHITITPHVGHLNWRGIHINLVDTPGYIDFLESTRGVMNIIGGAVMLFSAISGVKPESERLWSMAQDAALPSIGFINKMDKPRANFITVLGEIEQYLGVTTLPMTIPIGAGESFQGIVDLIPMTAWSAEDGRFTQIPLPESVRKDAQHYRTQLVERIVEDDEELLEKYLEEGQEPSEEQLIAGLKEAVLTRRIFPVFCGSALANIGVRALAIGIAQYLPHPLDRAAAKPLTVLDCETHADASTIFPDADGSFAGVVFKTIIDPFSGKLSVIRVFSGTIRAGTDVYNGTRQVKETLGNLYRLQGKETILVKVLCAGDIGAVAKLNTTQSGDTLCDVNRPVHFERVKYMEPTISQAVAVEPKSEDKVSTGLNKLAEEDPTLRFYREEQTREMILAGMGQTHLSTALARLKRKFGATATLKTPRVPYRESIRSKARVQGKIKKQTGGRGQYGDCWIEMEPLPRGEGFVFEDRVVGGVIPRQYIPSVHKGVIDAMAEGIVAGYPVVDVKVTLVDGSHHSVDSSDNAFKMAGAVAFRKGMEAGGAALLEPIMSMDITVPDDVLGGVIGDLNSRRGKVTGVTPKAGRQIIHADAPMVEVLEYGHILNALTSGRGLYTMRVATYQEVPSHIARKVLEGDAAGA